MNDGLSFIELAARLGSYAPASAALSRSYNAAAERDDEPHGVPWHTSFHASKAPWEDRWCPRRLVLELMDVPDGDVVDEQGNYIMAVGKDIEERFVQMWTKGKFLVTNPTGGLQTNFQDREVWLSGSPDAGIVPHGWDRMHIVEIKGKDNEREAFKKLRSGEGEPEPKHVAQLQTYLNMAERDLALAMTLMDLGVGAPESGSVMYFNRARPHQRVEFFFETDRQGYEQVRERLKQTKAAFLAEEMPEHPFGGKEWSVPPCQFCPFKKDVCKPAHKEKLTRLSEVAELAKKVDPEYDYQAKRAAIIDRWEGRGDAGPTS